MTTTSARAVAAPRRSVSTTLWDAAHAALFLASDEARYISGAELAVDGGLTLYGFEESANRTRLLKN